MLLVLTIALPCLHAQDFDEYKVRIFGFWLYSNPGGSFTDATTGDVIDIKKDFNFGSYSTFTGKVDWKFTRKNHFYVAGGSFSQSRVATLRRTIVFQGQTFNVGAVTKADLNAPLIAPGYSTTSFGADAEILDWRCSLTCSIRARPCLRQRRSTPTIK